MKQQMNSEFKYWSSVFKSLSTSNRARRDAGFQSESQTEENRKALIREMQPTLETNEYRLTVEDALRMYQEGEEARK